MPHAAMRMDHVPPASHRPANSSSLSEVKLESQGEDSWGETKKCGPVLTKAILSQNKTGIQSCLHKEGWSPTWIPFIASLWKRPPVLLFYDPAIRNGWDSIPASGCIVWLWTSLDCCTTNLTLTATIHDSSGFLPVVVPSASRKRTEIGTVGSHCSGEDLTA